MSSISTHILDVSLGRPAAGIEINIQHLGEKVGEGDFGFITDTDGRCRLPLDLTPGDYRLTFITGPYFAQRNQPTLYPEISICFTVEEGEQHYHIPLLLSPFGYTTYRGT